MWINSKYSWNSLQITLQYRRPTEKNMVRFILFTCFIMNINNLTDSARTWNHVIIPRTRNVSRFLLINVKTLLTDWSPKEYLSLQRDKCWMRQGQPEFHNPEPCKVYHDITATLFVSDKLAPEKTIYCTYYLLTEQWFIRDIGGLLLSLSWLAFPAFGKDLNLPDQMDGDWHRWFLVTCPLWTGWLLLFNSIYVIQRHVSISSLIFFKLWKTFYHCVSRLFFITVFGVKVHIYL